MYSRQLADESRIHLILYVDDMLIVGSNRAEIGKLKWSLHEKFAMKELGQARHILGMRIERNQTTKTLRLHVKGVEALQHAECEASINSISDDNPTIR